MTAIDRARRLPALRTCASGIRPLEAGTSLLIDCGGWLPREDFTRRFIIAGTSRIVIKVIMRGTGKTQA